MSESKEFYRHYMADDNWSDLSSKLLDEVFSFLPAHALEFGSGSGKHLTALTNMGVEGCGLDISTNNLLQSRFKNDNKFLILGDETHLRHLANFDVVFTCSVLDHIVDIDGIISEFKRIANKGILLAETNDVPAHYYYPHNYESYGFEKMNFTWKGDDGAQYFIWKFVKS